MAPAPLVSARSWAPVSEVGWLWLWAWFWALSIHGSAVCSHISTPSGSCSVRQHGLAGPPLCPAVPVPIPAASPPAVGWPASALRSVWQEGDGHGFASTAALGSVCGVTVCSLGLVPGVSLKVEVEALASDSVASACPGCGLSPALASLGFGVRAVCLLGAA